MRILIICHTMTSISGSPLYNYTLAKELKRRGHEVVVFSMWEDNEIRNNLVKEKIMTAYSEPPKGYYDLVFISQPDHKNHLDQIKAGKIINIVHSEYDCEEPITDKNIDHYVAIRPEIKEHLISSHHIDEDKISVIYNGIDFDKFNISKRKVNKNDYIKVVLPCTLDLLRKDFIEYYTRQASERFRVFIYGTNYDNDIYINQFVSVNDSVFDIENYIADADIVAGILLGRVNLEARAMGIVSYLHDPKYPENYKIYYPDYTKFKKRHDIKNVVNKLLSL